MGISHGTESHYSIRILLSPPPLSAGLCFLNRTGRIFAGNSDTIAVSPFRVETLISAGVNIAPTQVSVTVSYGVRVSNRVRVTAKWFLKLSNPNLDH